VGRDSGSPFSPKTLAFLRALKRNNDREWFRARKDQYEQHVRGPMVAVVERLAEDFRKIAPELVRLRAHIDETWPALRVLTSARAFRSRFESLQGDTMTRVPRGYAADHPAAAFLKFRQFYGGAELPAALAHSREFYPTLLATFRALMPLVRFLNEPLLEASAPSRTGVLDAQGDLSGGRRGSERLRGAHRTGSARFD
jgi:uncharacterized protein (DUF2461 family)